MTNHFDSKGGPQNIAQGDHAIGKQARRSTFFLGERSQGLNKGSRQAQSTVENPPEALHADRLNLFRPFA